MSGLGTGMGALLAENADINESDSVEKLKITQLEPNRDQPRKHFSEEAISSLADSIREYGMLQPILVRPIEDGQYIIVAGERRWRAARMLGLDEVPVIIKEMSDREAMEIALIENLQRENLNPIEEAEGYNILMDEYCLKQEIIAKTVGKSRSYIANIVRLLSLPDEIKEMLSENEISVGAAKAILSINDISLQIELANKSRDGKITVRAIENLAKAQNNKFKEDGITDIKLPKHTDTYYKEVEISLNEMLGRKVLVDFSEKKKKGTVVLEFYDKDDLNNLAKKIAEMKI